MIDAAPKSNTRADHVRGDVSALQLQDALAELNRQGRVGQLEILRALTGELFQPPRVLQRAGL